MVRQLAESFNVPCPIMGINAVSALAAMDPLSSIYAYNLVPSAYGLKVRNGYAEWVTGITGTGGVRTIIPVKAISAANNRLFAASADGLWTITATTAAPTKNVAFGTTTGNSGWCSWSNFTTSGGQFVAVCDEENGYYIHDVAANTWTKITAGAGANQISGIDPATFAFVVEYKGRLMFVPKNSSTMWYLPAGVYYGAASSFEFGDKFPHGGTLVGLYVYGADGGAGPNAYIVAVSSTGDVVMYNGTNPASDWTSAGKWYVGDLPVGRRVVHPSGGDLLILTTSGSIPLSRLTSGVEITAQDSYTTKNIRPLIQSDMARVRGTMGWETKLSPADGQLIIVVPTASGYTPRQYVQDLASRGWGVFRDLPVQTCENYENQLYIGGSNGKIYKYTGGQDGITLAGSGGIDVNWSLLTTSNNYGTTNLKQVSYIRAHFISGQIPAYIARAMYDFDLSEIVDSIASSGFSGSLFDSATWDSAVWGGDVAANSNINGSVGMGTYVAIALKGTSHSDTNIVAINGAMVGGAYM